MKRLKVLFLCAILMLALASPAFCAGTSLSASSTTLKVGDTVTFTVSVSGADDAKSAGIAVNYDSSKFKLVSGNWLLSGADMSRFDVNTSKGALMYTSATNMNGDLLTFTLQAISAATSAESVSAEVQMKDGASDIYSGTGYLSLSI